MSSVEVLHEWKIILRLSLNVNCKPLVSVTLKNENALLYCFEFSIGCFVLLLNLSFMSFCSAIV